MKKLIFRLFSVLAIIIVLGLLILKLSSGASDCAKGGLEIALSEFFSGTATIDELTEFDTIPNVIFGMKNLDVSEIHDSENITIEKLRLSVGFLDLFVLKNYQFVDFQLENLQSSEYSVVINRAGLSKDEEKQTGHFTFDGRYETQKISGKIDIGIKSDFQTKYFLNDQNSMTLNIGSTKVTGNYFVDKERNAQINHIKFSGFGKECQLPPEKTLPRTAFIKDVFSYIAKAQDFANLERLCNTLNQ